MTSHVGRLYVAAGSLLALFLAWAGIAAHPWKTQTSAASTQAQAVATYQLRLQRDAALIRQLSASQPVSTSAPAPQVRVVTLPPLTTTRTS